MNSLKQINYLINIAKNSKTGNYVILTLEGLEEIKKDLEKYEILKNKLITKVGSSHDQY